MISDAYTIPYLIKEHDQDSQYINASVSSRNFSDVMCNFKKELNFSCLSKLCIALSKKT